MFGENIELPDGFYICKNQNSLKAILKDMDINKNILKVEVDIKRYPCLMCVRDLSLEIGKVCLYGFDIEKLESIMEVLKQFKKGE